MHLGKNLQNFSLRGLSFVRWRLNVYQSALNSRNLPFPEKFLIYHWRILRSSYRQLACVESEPTTREFPPDALTNELSSHAFNSHSELTLYSYSNFIFFSVFSFFFKLGFTPCKAEQPLRGMEVQEKKDPKRLKHTGNLFRKNLQVKYVVNS